MRGSVIQWFDRALLIGVIGLLGYGLIEYSRKPSINAHVATEVKEAPAVRGVETAVVPVAPVKVYGPKAKQKLKLPADVKPTEHVIAATQVPESSRPQTVTTVLDEKTGESRSFVKVDPYPWFAIEPRGEARLAYGYKQDGWRVRPVTRLAVQYDVVRVKAVTIGVSGTLDSDGDAFVGIGAAIRF